MDFQNRVGSKTGGAGNLSESAANAERKERLRKLALETIDITKDPYFMRNHLGTFECKLCLTLHPNEGNYLAHTQAKRHQSNLARRAAMDARDGASRPVTVDKVETGRKIVRIGRPGYKVLKSRDPHTKQRSLIFEMDFPDGEEGYQPRHRFMSAYEQKVEVPDKNYQYLLFNCDPYETVAFKIPNIAIDRREGRFHTRWDSQEKKFILQLYFVEAEDRNPDISEVEMST
jgi:splicing factor 3A subunit 2